MFPNIPSEERLRQAQDDAIFIANMEGDKFVGELYLRFLLSRWPDILAIELDKYWRR